jgi:hypothetical protein
MVEKMRVRLEYFDANGLSVGGYNMDASHIRAVALERLKKGMSVKFSPLPSEVR